MTKKSGPKSELPSRLYNGAVISLASPICTIINQSFEILVTPLAWKNAEVTPIPKCSSVNELRPISLLCIPNKIAERIILKNMKPAFEELIDNNQFAYRSMSSSTCALIVLLDFVTKNLDTKHYEAVAMVTIDFSKAFDQIDHGLLLNKLLQYDRKTIPNDFIVWLKSYLTDRTQQVVLNGCYSRKLNITSGVPQGSILGPYLFNIFVSDLSTVSDRSQIVKFADDTTILIPISKNCVKEDCNLIGSEINNVILWATKNIMSINTNKSKILCFRWKSPHNCILPQECFGMTCCQNIKL